MDYFFPIILKKPDHLHSPIEVPLNSPIKKTARGMWWARKPPRGEDPSPTTCRAAKDYSTGPRVRTVVGLGFHMNLGKWIDYDRLTTNHGKTMGKP